MAFSTDQEVLVVFPSSLSSLTTVSALAAGSRLVVAAMPGAGCCGGDPAGVLESLVEPGRLTQLLPPPSAVSRSACRLSTKCLEISQRKMLCCRIQDLLGLSRGQAPATGTLVSPLAAQQHPQAQSLAELPPSPRQ